MTSWRTHCDVYVDVGSYFSVVAVLQELVPRREEVRRRTNSFCFLSNRGRAERGERCPNRSVPYKYRDEWLICSTTTTPEHLSWTELLLALLFFNPTYLLHSSVSDFPGGRIPGNSWHHFIVNTRIWIPCFRAFLHVSSLSPSSIHCSFCVS